MKDKEIMYISIIKNCYLHIKSVHIFRCWGVLVTVEF